MGNLEIFIGGVAGALWALAGVILFYLALEKQKESIGIQLETLTAQKDELRLTREELKETKLIFKEQSETQILIQFETSFHNLIQLFRDHIGRHYK